MIWGVKQEKYMLKRIVVGNPEGESHLIVLDEDDILKYILIELSGKV
jgi:hypothetical protein